MSGDLPGDDELEGLGLLDRYAPDAEDRRELLRYLVQLGASRDDIVAAEHLGELALDLKLRPRTGRTLAEAAADAGLDWARAERFLSAARLPAVPDRPVTVDEEALVRMVADAEGLLPDDVLVPVLRVAGSAMARVADAVVTAFRVQYELPQQAAGVRYVDVVRDYAALADGVLPEFVRSLDAMLRRQIVAVAEGVWTTDEERSSVTLPRTVGFADLVGYTAATTAMSARELSGVLLAFDERVSDIVAKHRGQVVKTIGDEVLFAVEDAGDACRLALDLVGAFGDDLPALRVGLAAGDVVSIFGDVYGPVVNLAARLVAHAEPGQAIASEAVCQAAGDAVGFVPLPPVELKGFSAPTTAYRITAR